MKIRKMGKFLRWTTPNDISAITLYPFGMYVRELPTEFTSSIINHELIHWCQQKEMIGLFFYVWYLIEWLFKLFGGSDAYYRISFEQEAYMNEDNADYTRTRKHYSWIKYVL